MIDRFLHKNECVQGKSIMFFKLWQALNKWEIIILNNFTQFSSKSIVFIIGTKNFKSYQRNLLGPLDFVSLNLIVHNHYCKMVAILTIPTFQICSLPWFVSIPKHREQWGFLILYLKIVSDKCIQMQ